MVVEWLVASLVGLVGLGLLAKAITVVKEWERVPVLRLGKFRAMRGPGLVIINPIVDKIPTRIDTRVKTVDVPAQMSLTKDNVPITIDAVIYYRVVDPQKAVLNVADYNDATSSLAQTVMRDTFGNKEFDEILAGVVNLGKEVEARLNPLTEPYGVDVIHVVLKQIKIPGHLEDAIARQAAAERERRSRVILAEAETQSADLMVQAADKYRDNPTAMELRWMNILFEVSKENATVILVPANIPTAALGAGDAMGFMAGAEAARRASRIAKAKKEAGAEAAA
ncbi:MAG: slipin family protein [Methanobacteriota archaeon]|nr:MAG: slipin family protein [Euryarchaeota archaeon]